MYVVFCKIDHCIHIHWCIVMGLGHNDPWVESHMWHQQTWGQRSSRGQWPLVQFFGKKGSVYPHTFNVFSNLIYYNECKRMWSRKQARHVVREPPCLSWEISSGGIYVWLELKLPNVICSIQRFFELALIYPTPWILFLLVWWHTQFLTSTSWA